MPAAGGLARDAGLAGDFGLAATFFEESGCLQAAGFQRLEITFDTLRITHAGNYRMGQEVCHYIIRDSIGEIAVRAHAKLFNLAPAPNLPLLSGSPALGPFAFRRRLAYRFADGGQELLHPLAKRRRDRQHRGLGHPPFELLEIRFRG
jgi:hypothetical protein